MIYMKPKPSSTQKNILGRCPEANKIHPGHCISSNIDTLQVKPGEKFDYAFQIQNEAGQPLTEFEIGHEKMMHVLLIRKDRTGFQHLHPEFDDKSGTFTIKDMVIPEEGSYRLFADFIDSNITDPGKSNIVIYEDIQIGSVETKSKPTSTMEVSKQFGSYDVVMLSQPEIVSVGVQTKLAFLISDNNAGGTPVKNLGQYLGAYGHAVMFDDQLNLVHTHPVTGSNEASRGIVEFEFVPASEGNVAVFAQFQIGSELLTTNFGLRVNKTLSEIDKKINSGQHDGH